MGAFPARAVFWALVLVLLEALGMRGQQVMIPRAVLLDAPLTTSTSPPSQPKATARWLPRINLPVTQSHVVVTHESSTFSPVNQPRAYFSPVIYQSYPFPVIQPPWWLMQPPPPQRYNRTHQLVFFRQNASEPQLDMYRTSNVYFQSFQYPSPFVPLADPTRAATQPPNDPQLPANPAQLPRTPLGPAQAQIYSKKSQQPYSVQVMVHTFPVPQDSSQSPQPQPQVYVQPPVNVLQGYVPHIIYYVPSSVPGASYVLQSQGGSAASGSRTPVPHALSPRPVYHGASSPPKLLVNQLGGPQASLIGAAAMKRPGVQQTTSSSSSSEGPLAGSAFRVITNSTGATTKKPQNAKQQQPSANTIFLSPLMHSMAQMVGRDIGVGQFFEVHGCVDPQAYLPPLTQFAGLSRGCPAAQSQQACQAVGHAVTESLPVNPTLMSMLNVLNSLLPPTTRTLLETCLTHRMVSKVMMGQRAQRAGANDPLKQVSMMMKVMESLRASRTQKATAANATLVAASTTGHSASDRNSAMRSVPPALRGVVDAMKSHGQRQGQGQPNTEEFCEHLLSFMTVKAGVVPTTVDSVMDAVRDFRRQLLPFQCQEMKVGAIPLRMCCPGHVHQPTLLDIAMLTPA